MRKYIDLDIILREAKMTIKCIASPIMKGKYFVFLVNLPYTTLICHMWQH